MDEASLLFFVSSLFFSVFVNVLFPLFSAFSRRFPALIVVSNGIIKIDLVHILIASFSPILLKVRMLYHTNNLSVMNASPIMSMSTMTSPRNGASSKNMIWILSLIWRFFIGDNVIIEISWVDNSVLLIHKDVRSSVSLSIPEPVTCYKDLVRIILIWCRWPDLNRHGR